jgi:hypothetical protein
MPAACQALWCVCANVGRSSKLIPAQGRDGRGDVMERLAHCTETASAGPPIGGDAGDRSAATGGGA